MWFRDRERDEELAAQLISLCDAAWNTGDIGDRGAVMRFVFFRKDETHFHLLVDGLRSEDAIIASQAIGYVASLIQEGLYLDPSVRDALLEFGNRFAELRDLCEDSVELLDAGRADGDGG
jgi:hypothetical protein